MYAQCDQNGNDVMILDEMVDFQKSKNALTNKQQKMSSTESHHSVNQQLVGKKWKDGSTS